MTFLDNIQDLDRHVSLAINSLHSTWSDQVWMFFSDKNVWFLLYFCVAAAMLGRLGWKKGLVAILSVVLTIVLCDQGGNFVKFTVARFRPCWDSWMVQNGLHILEGRFDYYGFYSAHAANSMGFAICSALCLKWDRESEYRIYTTSILIWAVLVGMSRVFVGRHFFGDVLAGFAVGLLFGWVCSRIGRFFADRISR